MKRLKKTFRIIIVISILSTITYFFLLSDFNGMFKNERFVQVQEDIKNVKDDKELTSIVSLYNKIYTSGEKHCPCEMATHYINNYSVFKPSFSKMIYRLKLQKQYDENSCLKFLLLNRAFLHGVVGIKEASAYYFAKSLNELNEEQEIALLVMFENPSFYDLFLREKDVKQKVQRYQNLLNNKNSS